MPGLHDVRGRFRVGLVVREDPLGGTAIRQHVVVGGRVWTSLAAIRTHVERLRADTGAPYTVIADTYPATIPDLEAANASPE